MLIWRRPFLNMLSEHLKMHCDARLPGVLSLSIRESYRFLEEIIQREKVLQRPEMKKTWGYLRHGLIDVGLKQVLQSSNIEHEIADKASSRYRNGHTYLMIETKGAILTPSKVLRASAVPRKAIFRDKGSILNKRYSLFEDPKDINQEYNEANPPFMLLTYGGTNHELSFVRLGLPDIENRCWMDQVDITNAPVVLANPEEITNELHLSFTLEAEELIKRGVKNVGKEGI